MIVLALTMLLWILVWALALSGSGSAQPSLREQAEHELHLDTRSRVDVRRDLRTAIFGRSQLPKGAAKVAASTTVYPGAKTVQEVTAPVSYGPASRSHLLHAREPNGRLLIHHSGHNREKTALEAAQHEISFFLRRGFDVLAVDMPRHGENRAEVAPTCPVTVEDSAYDHAVYACAKHPLEPFIAPVVKALNALKYERVAMMGLSGGGWATGVVSAIDPRIERSYPVAGTWPVYLREHDGTPSSLGDYEQRYRPMLEAASYLDQYALAERQLQVFNARDDCCFRGPGFRTYVPVVQSVTPGFRARLDRFATGHEVSRWALELIYRDLTGR